MYSNLMHKYFKNTSEDTIQPTTEGWGIALTRLGIIAGVWGAAFSAVGPASRVIGTAAGKAFGTGAAGIAAAGVGGAAVGAGLGHAAVKGSTALTGMATKKLTANMFDNITKHQKLKKYIQDQCDKIFKATKKEYGNLSTNVDTSTVQKIAKAGGAVGNVITFSELLKNQFASSSTADEKFLKIGKYSIEILFDTNSISAMIVIFTASDGKRTEYIAKRIPAPTNSELAKMFDK